MDRIKEGTDVPCEDDLSFEDIYEQYCPRVFKFVSYRLNDREAAQDVTSDIFLKVYNHQSHYDPRRGNFEVWLFSIASNTVKDYYRKKSRFRWLPLIHAKDIPAPGESAEEHLEKEEETAYLRKCIARQQPRDQLILSYKYGAELSNKDIAQLMNTTPNHVGVILHRLLKKLKEEMEEYYEREQS